MADSYQAIYDAVRSRISGGNIGDAVSRAAHESFDISQAAAMVRDGFLSAASDMQRPSVLFRPALSADGTQWCALLGENIQEGVAGFGDTPAAAMEAFDKAFWSNGPSAKSRRLCPAV